MSQAQRLALIVGAVLVLVVGFVVASGSKDDGKSTSTAASVPTATPTGATTATSPTATATTTATTPAPAPATTIAVRGGKPQNGITKLQFSKGDQVAFRVTSDVADEIHVHGYDLMKDVKAGGSVSFAFKAKIDGIFEIELENAGVQIAELRVDP